MKDKKIRIIKDGPYLVEGGIPLIEKIIRNDGHENYYEIGRTFAVGEEYLLCSCGKSSTKPFCDGTHAAIHYNGAEQASRKNYLDQAAEYDGPELILTDQENLCAFARFCHKGHGDVWNLTLSSDNPIHKKEAIAAAEDCPAGRLIAWNKDSKIPYLPDEEAAITIIQDPEKKCSGPIWVKGNVPLVSSDGTEYERRYQMTLCRCGESDNKPFCDAMHVSIQFDDRYSK